MGGKTRTVSRAGVDLAVVEAGARTRPTIVLLHGYPDAKDVWEPVFERLAARFHVVAYDSRGAGESTAPRGPWAYSFDHLAGDLEAVLDDLVEPDKAVHLVGHDWGGIQGWEFAAMERFDARLASFTSVAGPSLDQVKRTLGRRLSRGGVGAVLSRLRRSWYVAVLSAPGGPSLAWRLLLRGDRWAWYLRTVERVPTGEGYPAPSVIADGLHGANLYRRNIAARLAARPRAHPARVPVQLIVPSGDHFLAEGYYEEAEAFAPILWRRQVGGSHWTPRTHPDLLARWVGEFVEAVETGAPEPGPAPWVRGGGTEQISGRLALVTGAASGIGRATAAALAEQGARLLLVDRDGPTLRALAPELPGAHTFTCDVSDEAAMRRLANRVIGEHGVPDIVINNAGIAVAGPFLAHGFDDWRSVLGVNLMGVVHGCRLFGEAMVQRGAGGHIVNTASAAAFQPTRELPAYATSKAAVLMLSECVRAELVPHGIGVTAVCPGLIATNITRATRYLGQDDAGQERLRSEVTRLYQRRGFGPERVAAEIVQAIGRDDPVAVITFEAKLMRGLSRFAPGLLRRLASAELLPS